MKKTTFLILIICMGIVTFTFSQKASITLTFTAVNNAQYVLLDSVYIENLTQGGDTTIYAPQSSLVIENVGIDDVSIENQTMTLSQNYPNPIRQQSNVNLFLPEKEDITIRIHNLIGQVVTSFKGKLSNGNHSFTFYPGNEDIYMLTVFASSGSQSIKMVNITRNGNKQCKIVYCSNSNNENAFKSLQSTMGFVFSYGDELRYIGYAKTTEQIAGAGVLEDAPQMDKSYEFEISAGMPCQEELYVMYEGQQYNTVQIGNQCWLKENLNVGTRIDGEYGQVDNGLLEKYCYNDEEDSCTVYGALYQWKEMMQYSTTQGVQGICPDGWHVPTDAEWCTLTQFIDPNVDCNLVGLIGIDVGIKMKSTSGWVMDGNGTDIFGFTAIPSGLRIASVGNFLLHGEAGYFWTSTKAGLNNGWFRRLGWDFWGIIQDNDSKDYGMPVRCIKGTPSSWVCGDTIHDSRDNMVYSTVEIGEQCWMQENMNIGVKIDGDYDQANNGLIEKYCYNNEEDSCDTYGGLYQWDEVMQYNTITPAQGICLPGWHIPSDEEWQQLEGEVDSQYNYPDPIWYQTGFRGFDAGGNLKETDTIHWLPPNLGATNSSGFTGLPGGYRHSSGEFLLYGDEAIFWTSYYSGANALRRYLDYDDARVYRGNIEKYLGFSVRCVKD